MFRFVSKTIRAFEQALYLNQIATEYSDPEEMREKLLAVIHGRAESAASDCHSEEECRRIAA